MNTACARGLFARARRQGFGVGAFNADNLETMVAIARAARRLDAPVLIETSASEVDVLGLRNIRSVADNLVAEYGVELYLNLDHAPSVDRVRAALDAGFELVHLDLGRAASYEELVEDTREAVAAAAVTGALVEGEIGSFAGSSTVHREAADPSAVAATLTDPGRAAAFVADTGIDTFAVGIGNLHGRYPASKQLDFELLGRIRVAVGGYLSLHGGSGTDDSAYADAIAGGITKINVNSDLRHAYRTALERELAQHPREYAIVKLVPAVIDSVQAVVEAKIRAFGSAGRSRPIRLGPALPAASASR